MSERSKNTFFVDRLAPQGLFYPKTYYKKGLLCSSQIGSVSQESLWRAINSTDPTKLMQSPSGEVVVFDGHHRTALAILRDETIPYELIPYLPYIRIAPFRLIVNSIKRFLPPGFDMNLQ